MLIVNWNILFDTNTTGEKSLTGIISRVFIFVGLATLLLIMNRGNSVENIDPLKM